VDLQKRLDKIREGFEKQAPPEVLAVFHRVTDDLRASGIAEASVQEGQKAPPFELESSRGGGVVSLGGLLERGPLVLTFFRGHW
jgi:hypothetical protein